MLLQRVRLPGGRYASLVGSCPLLKNQLLLLCGSHLHLIKARYFEWREACELLNVLQVDGCNPELWRKHLSGPPSIWDSVAITDAGRAERLEQEGKAEQQRVQKEQQALRMEKVTSQEADTFRLLGPPAPLLGV